MYIYIYMYTGNFLGWNGESPIQGRKSLVVESPKNPEALLYGLVMMITLAFGDIYHSSSETDAKLHDPLPLMDWTLHQFP